LSRKAILKEQRAKMGGAPPPPDSDGGQESDEHAGPAAGSATSHSAPTAVIEGGAEFDTDDEPNFNRVDGAVAAEPGAARPEAGRENRGAAGDRDRNRRRRGGRGGRGPGGGSGHGGQGGGGGGRFRR
jgi:polyribonucleotide nucleotidyltransferase